MAVPSKSQPTAYSCHGRQNETHLRLAIACHDQAQCADVQASKNELSKEYILPSFRHAIQTAIYVDVCCWVYQGARIPFDQGVVAFAFEVLVDLLHVRFPIDLCILAALAVTCMTRCQLAKARRTEFAWNIHGTFQMMSAQRALSAVSRSGDSHREVAGSLLMLIVRR